jgi:hypothetical protein
LMSADKQAFAYVEPDNVLNMPLKTIEAAPSLQKVASGSGEFVPVDENGEPLDVRDMSPDERICHFLFFGYVPRARRRTDQARRLLVGELPQNA